MQDHHSSLPADFSGKVRVFTLPNVVVFPTSINPLRVFESRYQEMFEDAMQRRSALSYGHFAARSLRPFAAGYNYLRRPCSRSIGVMMRAHLLQFMAQHFPELLINQIPKEH